MAVIKKDLIGIIGLGYVGLPLAIEFGKKYSVVGYDSNKQRVAGLKNCIDTTKELNEESIRSVLKKKIDKTIGVFFTNKLEHLKDCNIYIISVPTPITKFKEPDLSFLLSATYDVGCILKKKDIVIYESTVYPGCTEEDCVPILESASGLKFNKDFFCGYSPERINPGDKVHTLTKIIKIVSGSTIATANRIERLYASIITAGTYKTSSIKIAEASKAIENAQRDINISFVNELSLIFDKLGVDTNDVLKAASTKWNFLNFKPGLVGGHCVGVDPYYLVHKSKSIGYYPQVILSGRRVNDSMGFFIANKIIKLLIQKKNKIEGATALILGFTFKENCSDSRNTKVFDLYSELVEYGISVDVFDPNANIEKVKKEYQLELLNEINIKKYDAIILAVAHDLFQKIDVAALKKSNSSIIYDIRNYLPRNIVDGRL